MQLMSQFLFLHPTHKRLVEFVSETVFLSFIKYYRQNDFKKQLNELNKEYYSLDLDKETDLLELDVSYYYLYIKGVMLLLMNKTKMCS